MCRNFSISSTCFRDMSIASTCCRWEWGTEQRNLSKGFLHSVLNNRSEYLKISIEMPQIKFMTSIRAILNLNNMLLCHTGFNKIGRIRTRQHQSTTDFRLVICRNFSIFSTRFWDMSMASTCGEWG